MIQLPLTIALNALFILLPLGQFGRLSILGQQINAYVYEVPLVIALALLIIRYRLQPVRTMWQRHPALSAFAAWLVLVTTLSLAAYSWLANVTALLYLARVLVYLFTYLYLQYHLAKSSIHRQTIVHGIVIVTALSLISGFLQYIVLPDLSSFYYEGWDPHLYRLFGLYFDPSVAGAIYSLLLLAILSGHASKRFKAVSIGLLSLAILFTYSRGTYVALIVAMAVVAVRRRLWYALAAAIMVIAVGVVILPKPQGEGVNLLRSSTVFSRFADYEEGITIWRRNPILGIGYNHIRAEKKNGDQLSANGRTFSHAGASFHSSFLIVLVTAGVVGLLLFIGMIIELGMGGVMPSSLVVFLAVASCFDNVLLHPFVLILWLLMIARVSRS